MEHSTISCFYLLQTLLIITTHLIPSNFTDQIPFSSGEVDDCRKITKNTDQCNTYKSESLTWTVIYKNTFPNSYQTTPNKNFKECRKLCLKDSRCTAVSINDRNECQFGEKIDSNSLRIDKQYDTAILACCLTYKIKIVPEKIINEASLSCQCYADKNKKCSNPRYLKHEKSIYEGSNGFLELNQVSFEWCLQSCNRDFLCITFHYVTTEKKCSLFKSYIQMKYSIHSSVYKLQCCDDYIPLTAGDIDECRIINKPTEKCNKDNNEILTWRVEYNHTFKFFLQKRTSISLIQCKEACLYDAHCMAVTFQYGTCLFGDIKKIFPLQEHKNFDTSILACCKKDQMKILAETLIKNSDELDTCTEFDSNKYCPYPKLVKYQRSKLSSQYISMLRGATLDWCIYSCNKDRRCKLFTYSENRRCLLHQEETDFNDEDCSSAYKRLCCTGGEPLVSVGNVNSCKKVKQNTDRCNQHNDEFLTWIMMYSHKNEWLIEKYNNVTFEKCRQLCLNHYRCTAVNYNKYECQLTCCIENSSPSQNHHFDVAILACCPRSHVKFLTEHVIKSTEAPSSCSFHQKGKRCAKQFYVKYEDAQMNSRELTTMNGATLEWCKYSCNKNHHCSVFTYFRNGKCTLHEFDTRPNPKNDVSTYKLMCC